MHTENNNQTLPNSATSAVKAMAGHPSPVILLSLVLGFSAYRFTQGPWQSAELIAPLLMLAVWPVWEWAIHVFLLHFKPLNVFNRQWDFSLPKKHRQHHKEPWDLSNIFIHLPVFPVAVPALALLFYGLMPSTEMATSALAVFFLLALNYEFAHFLAHINWCPPLGYYKRRVKLHRLHHFRNEQMWWGVSMGLGDVLLGTAPDINAAPRSDTVANLHGLDK